MRDTEKILIGGALVGIVGYLLYQYLSKKQIYAELPSGGGTVQLPSPQVTGSIQPASPEGGGFMSINIILPPYVGATVLYVKPISPNSVYAP